MKLAKKCVGVVIALLPIIVILFYMVSHFGNNVASDIIELGKIDLKSADGGYYIYTDPGTWGEILITPITGEFVYKGLMKAICGFCLFLDVNAGIPVSVPSFFAVLYLIYFAFVELISVLLDFVLFVPRKCAELFR